MALLDRNALSKFLASFDPINKKYACVDKNLNFDLYKKMYDFESARQFAYIFKREYDISYDNIKLIYNSSTKEASDIVNIYVSTRKKIIEQYLNIKGLEQLFSELFLEFEWDMHSSIKVDESKHNFYRDHFIHQIRVLFELDTMLDEFCYLDDVKAIILQNKNNKVCKYIMNQIDLEVERITSNIKEYELWIEIGKEYYADTDFSKWLKQRILEIFIRQAIYVAALFHDIGYPIAHSIKVHKRIFDYAADIYTSSSFSNIDFQEIEKKLGKSLLFQIMKNDNIKCGFDKLDHGALSAIVFLLHFYENSSLITNTPLQIAVIEIAALAMYNHTLKYKIVGEKNAAYFRPVYKNNPISFLLRVADDVQEWDRVYFDFQKNKNFCFCDKCKTPIINVVCKNSENHIGICRGNYGVALKDDKKYCSYNNGLDFECENNYLFSMFIKESELQTHSISIIKMCSSAVFEKMENITGTKKINFITLNYDPYLLLLRTMSKPDFSEFTCKDFRRLKVKLQGQIELGIDYFLTSNPISLKVKILQLHFISWLENNNIKKDNINDDVFNKYYKYLKEIIKTIKEEINGKKIKKEDYEKDIQKRIRVYWHLLKYWYDSTKYKNTNHRTLAKNDVFKIVYDDAIRDLNHFPFWGFAQEALNSSLNNEKYLELSTKEKSAKVLDYISTYTKVMMNDTLPIRAGQIYLDFYSDLYFFKLIYDKDYRIQPNDTKETDDSYAFKGE